MSRSPLALLAVVIALVGGTAVSAASGRPSTPGPAQPGVVPVVGASAVCPDLRQVAGSLSTRISVGTAAGPSGQDATDGVVEALRSSAVGSTQRVPVTEPGEVAVALGTDVDRDGLAVTASGSLAAGLEVEQVTRGERGSERGLAGLRCEPPTTDAWFEGSTTVVGDIAVLVLANTDDTPALVDTTLWSAEGLVDSRPLRVVTVPPHTRVLLQLADVAPDRNLLAMHVQTRRGRVAAALRHARYDGVVPRGVEWVPQAQPPASTVVVPGIPAGPGGRTLLLTAPGQDDLTVSLQVTTQDGQFVPTGLDQVSVPAGTTVAVPLSTLTAETAMAVRVVSDGGPVLAGAYVLDGQTGPVREISYTAQSAPLTGPALLTDVVLNRPTESTLVLTALDQDATVVVTPVRVIGITQDLPPARTVRVPGGRTVPFRLSTLLPPGATARFGVEVRPAPGSGPVYVARYLRERGAKGPLTTLLDLQGPAQSVPRPVVVRDPGVG